MIQVAPWKKRVDILRLYNQTLVLNPKDTPSFWDAVNQYYWLEGLVETLTGDLDFSVEE